MVTTPRASRLRSGFILLAAMTMCAATLVTLHAAEAGVGDTVLNPGPVTMTVNTGGFLNLGGKGFPFKTTADLAECANGLNDDMSLTGGNPQDTNIDFDGGASHAVVPATPVDTQCAAGSPALTYPASADDSETQAGFQPREYITLTGAVDKNGNISVPQVGVVFPHFYVYARSGGLGVTVAVTPTATAAATGHLDPATGVVTFHIDWQLDIFNAVFFDCVAPISMDLSSDPAAAVNAGPILVNPQAYNTSTGTATVSSNEFAVGASVPGPTPVGYPTTSPTSAATCNSLVNANFGLPSGARLNAIELPVSSNATFQSGTTTSSSTTSGSTASTATTAAPTTTSTAAPTTTSTAAPTTTSTAAPTTTTTAPPGPSVKVTPSSLVPGQSFVVSGTGWKPGSSVVATLNSTPITLGTLVADSGGAVSGTFAVPAGFSLGAHTVVLSGTGIAGQLNQAVAADVTVGAAILANVTTTSVAPAAAPVAATTGTLPTTGSDSSTLAGMAMLLLGTGGALVLVTRRRSTQR